MIKSTSLCFETIKVVKGKALHINYHNNRCNYTRQKLFTCKDEINLQDFINPPTLKEYRCKIIYGKDVEKVEFFPLVKRSFQSFTCKEIDFEYPYKFLDREKIDEVKQSVKTDDVIFTHKGKLLDTSIANIVLFLDGEWLTPEKPLLFGTTRERLIEKKIIKEANLDTRDLREAKNFAIINALLDWQTIKNFKIEE